MNPWHTSRHQRIAARICREQELPSHRCAEIETSNARGCVEYGEWNHHRPEFNAPKEMAAEIIDVEGIAVFVIEDEETGAYVLNEEERAAFNDLQEHTGKALHAAGRMEAAREARAARVAVAENEGDQQ